MGLTFETTQRFQNMRISTTLQPLAANVRKWEIKDPVPSRTHNKALVCISLGTGAFATVPIKYETVTAVFLISKA